MKPISNSIEVNNDEINYKEFIAQVYSGYI